MQQSIPVVTPRLGVLLKAVFLLFALLVVNSVYLSAITVLEAFTGTLYQDYSYLLMFLAHLVLGLLLVIPFTLFIAGHLPRALRRHNRDAVRAGLGLLAASILLLLTGLLLTRFGIFELNDPQWRNAAYWLHVISPLVVVWLFVLHRLAGPAIHWRAGLRWSVVTVGFAALMLALETGLHEPESVVETLFTPSFARLAGSERIPAAHLMTDEQCAECHADIAADHEYSMHRFSSMNNPFYLFSVQETREVIQQRDGAPGATRFCAACHDPVPLFSGLFDDPEFDLAADPTGQAGITCVSCHAMQRVNSVLGNGDYTLVDPPRYPFADSDGGLLKELNHLLIRAKPEFHKKTLLQPFHRSAEFCSTCHKVSLPEAFNHYRWLRGQDHYDSFLQSGVSGHNVDSFYYPQQAVDRCAHCHMPLAESDDPAARDFDASGKRSIHGHRFPAANTGVAHQLNMPEQVIAAQQARLHDITRIDIFGIREDGRVDGTLHAPLRPAVPVLEPGKRYLVELVIRTTGVGHQLTQGTVDSNELWMEFTATDSLGAVFGHSGGRAGDGRIDPWAYFVNAYVLDRNGNRIDRRNAQDIFIALYNHQIPPGATAVVHYLLDIPDTATGSITLAAKLNYRKFDTTYLRHVQGDEFRCNDLPVTIMASDRVVLPIDAQPVQPDAQDVPVVPADRWNDYGIGLLREGVELGQAAQAFAEVERLGRGDGALNQARVYYRTGQLEEATAALQRAQNADTPAYPWTIAWFSALVDHQNGHLDSAIETLEALVDTRFAEARRRGLDFSLDLDLLTELGRALYERARQLRGAQHQDERRALLERAQARFTQLLEVNPEDDSAHYNLALVYAQQGDQALSQQHRGLHQKYRPDDAAIEQAVTRHRSDNPAADHAAAQLVIYPLVREDNTWTAPGTEPPTCHNGTTP